MGNDKSNDKLQGEAEREITNLFESVLDYAQVACDPKTYPALRSKILRVGNNCIRNIRKKIKMYDVEYKAVSEEVIEFCQNTEK